MTTENTDAATRILTKTIRKLAEQLAEADGSIRYEEGKRKGAEDELMAVRAELAGSRKPDTVDIRRGAYFLEWHATPVETVGQLAAKRMAELAEARAENQKRVAQVDERVKLVGERMVDLEGRIERAIEALSDGREPLSAIVAILRGEA